MRRILLAAAVVFWLAAPAVAQQLVTGNLTATNDTVTAFIPANTPSVAIQVAGTWTGTITFQGSADGVTFVSLLSSNVTTGATATSTTANAVFSASNSGYAVVRAFGTSIASGSAVVTIVRGGGGAAGGGGSVTQGTSPWVVAGNGTYGTAGTTPVTTQLCDSDSCAGVSGISLFVVGGQTANGAAAGSNRVATLPAIVQNSAPSLTDGRDAALSLTTGGAQRVMITNAAGTASTIATDATFGTTTYTETSTTGPLVGAVRTDTPAALANTTNEVAPLSSSALGGVYTASASDPCDRIAKSYYVINTTSAATFEIANASGSNHWYVCSVNVVAGAAQGLLIAEDDTDGCGSITAGLNGGTTAATGWQIAANGGVALGNGSGTVMRTATGGRYFCLLTSTTAQTSGTIAYVSAP